MAPVQFKFFSHEFLKKSKLKFYNGIYHEDELFSFSAYMKAKRVMCISDILYNYYRNPGSITKQNVTFHHLDSLIIVFKEIFRFVEKTKLNKPLKSVIIDHLAKLYWAIRERMNRLGISNLPETSELFDSKTKDFYYFLKKSFFFQPVNLKLTKEHLLFLKHFSHVVVYGAGKIAKQLIPELVQGGIENIEIVVSKADENVKTLYGYTIREIKSLTFEKEKTIIIIGVGKKLTPEIREIVISLGYKNIIEF